MNLAPPNATSLERSLADALQAVADLPVTIGTLWNPDACPTSQLPWLAWAVSVDVWDPDWQEDFKRAAIRSSYRVHRHKGTAGAVKTALAALGRQSAVIEWWQESPPAQRGTFAVEALLDDQGVTPALYAEIERIALSTKNARSHLRRVSIIARPTGGIFIGGPIRTAETVTLEPAVIT